MPNKRIEEFAQGDENFHTVYIKENESRLKLLYEETIKSLTKKNIYINQNNKDNR